MSTKEVETEPSFFNALATLAVSVVNPRLARLGDHGARLACCLIAIGSLVSTIIVTYFLVELSETEECTTQQLRFADQVLERNQGSEWFQDRIATDFTCANGQVIADTIVNTERFTTPYMFSGLATDVRLDYKFDLGVETRPILFPDALNLTLSNPRSLITPLFIPLQEQSEIGVSAAFVGHNCPYFEFRDIGPPPLRQFCNAMIEGNWTTVEKNWPLLNAAVEYSQSRAEAASAIFRFSSGMFNHFLDQVDKNNLIIRGQYVLFTIKGVPSEMEHQLAFLRGEPIPSTSNMWDVSFISQISGSQQLTIQFTPSKGTKLSSTNIHLNLQVRTNYGTSLFVLPCTEESCTAQHQVFTGAFGATMNVLFSEFMAEYFGARLLSRTSLYCCTTFKTGIVPALGVAFAYTAVIEVGVTIIVLGLLSRFGCIRLSRNQLLFASIEADSNMVSSKSL